MATPLESNCYCLCCQPDWIFCVLGSGLNRSGPARNEAASSGILEHPPVILSFRQTILPRVEMDQPGVYSVWSQVTDFPEVELRLLQKRDWRVVNSQKWKFGDDILLREARALFRGLKMMVCAEHVRNARVLCLTDSVSCALAFERRRARNFKLLVQIRKLTALCLCHQINFHVRWTASESIEPSRRHELFQHATRDFSNNLLDGLSPFCTGELLNHGNEGAMLARPTESVPLEPEAS